MLPVSVVILSGGRSSRMGQPKALLSIKGRNFVEYIADHLSAASEILFSVKMEGDFPQVILPHIPDAYPGCGPLAGIHSALKHAENPWVFIVACDTPFVTWELVENLYSYASEETCAVIPMENDGRLHAVCGLYHKRMLPLLEKMLEEGNYRVRQALSSKHCVFVPVFDIVDHQKVFFNINTMEDYEKLCL